MQLPRRPSLSLLVAVLAAWPAVAGAAQPCEIDVVPDGAGAWQSAASELEETLAREPGDGDCGRVLVDLSGENALVTFGTRDGRYTQRELRDPSELAPTIKALRVTYLAAEPDAPQHPASDDESPPTIAAPPEIALVRRSAPLAQPTSAIYGLQVGMRGGDRLVTPTIELFVLLGSDGWDYGLFLRTEAYYRNTDESAKQPHTTGGSFGLTVGRRIPFGALALVAGGSIGLAGYYQENLDLERGEGRLGAYVGVVTPRRTRTRLRATLASELAMTHLGASERDRSGTLLMPWHAVMLSLAVEYGGP